MGKNRRAIIWYSTQFRNNLSLYIILSTHSITNIGILKKITINAFFLEIQCLDIFHNWCKMKMTVISIRNCHHFNMAIRDFPWYLHWSTSTKGKEQRLGVYPGGHNLQDLSSWMSLHLHVAWIILGLQQRWLSSLSFKSTQSTSLNHFLLLFVYLQNGVIGAWLVLWKASQKRSWSVISITTEFTK